MLESFDDAEAIYLLGDMLDFWFEYRNVVPKGFARFFATLQRLTDRGVHIFWLHGNHDMWTGDFFASQLGVKVIDDTYYNIQYEGMTIVACHGDTIGRVPTSYRILRKLFRSALCRRLLATIHPALTMRVALGWSASSRKKEPRQINLDKTALRKWAETYLDAHITIPPTRFIICGHMHADARITLPEQHAELVILADSYRTFSYAKISNKKLGIHHFDITE